MPRILSLDFGDRRLGFAVSDDDEIMALPLKTVICTNPQEAPKTVLAVVTEQRAAKLVIGLPRNMDGSEGPAAKKVRELIEKLKPKVTIPIETWDERLSTKSAHDALMGAGKDGRERKGLVDQVAAQIILQNYLDAQQFRRGT